MCSYTGEVKFSFCKVLYYPPAVPYFCAFPIRDSSFGWGVCVDNWDFLASKHL